MAKKALEFREERVDIIIVPHSWQYRWEIGKNL
jgi:hypothetical protein